MIRGLFLDHPRSVGEGYGQHAAIAAHFGGTMIIAGLACCIHAIIPALFKRTASDAIKELYGEMRSRQPAFADRPASYQEPEWQLDYEI